MIWAIGSAYKNVLDENPYVDQVMEIPISNRMEVKTKWFAFEKMITNLKRLTVFDEVYFTQIYPGYPSRFHGCLRASMFRIYSNTTTVPLEPVLRLKQEEVDHVKEFAEKHNLKKYDNVVLFECSPESNQSFITREKAEKIALLASLREATNTCYILSGKEGGTHELDFIIDGSELSVRETAELTKYCTMLVGTGSGITMVCQSNWAKPLPTIQLLTEHSTASLKWDHEYFGLPTNRIIETTSEDIGHIMYCITDAIKNFNAAKLGYDETIKPDFNIIRFHMYFDTAMITGNYSDLIPAFIATCKEYGLSKDLLRFFGTFPESIATVISRKMKGVI